MINSISFKVEFWGMSSNTLVTIISSALLTLMILPIGSFDPNKAFAVDSDNIMEFFSLSPFSSPLRILKSKIFNASSCI